MENLQKRYVPLDRGHIQLGKNEESAILEWSSHNVYSIRKTPSSVPVTIQDPALLKNPQIHPGKRILETSLTWMKWIYGPKEIIENLFTANTPTRTQKMRRLLAAKVSVLKRIKREGRRKPNSGDLSAMENGELRMIDRKINFLQLECLDVAEAAHQNRIKDELEAIMADREHYQHMMRQLKEMGNGAILTKQEACEEYETYQMLAWNGRKRETKLLTALQEAQKDYLDAYKALQLLEEENEKETITSINY